MAQARLHRWFTRPALALAGLALGLVLAEAALRLAYPSLPSLSAAEGRQDLIKPFRLPKQQRFREDLICDQGEYEVLGEDRRHGEGSPIRTLWFTGDSMTAGMGVGAGEAWPDRLGELLARGRPGTVVVRNLGEPGISYCEVLRRAHIELQHGYPDLLVVTLFGDDLEARALLALDGRLVGLPYTIPGPGLRWLASHSYLGNLGWFATRSRSKEPVRFIDKAGRTAFRRNMEQLVKRVHKAGSQTLVILLEPVGIDSCTDKARKHLWNRCAWMPQDLELMATLLDEAGIPYLDLRGVWAGSGAAPIASEKNAMPAIHPDARGHEHLARVIFEREGPLLLGSPRPPALAQEGGPNESR